MPSTLDPATERFFLRHGRYHLPARHFYHRLLADQLAAIGLEVTWVERFDPHCVWQVKIRLTARAQLHLLLGVPCAKPFANRLLERQLRVYLCQALQEWGPKLPLSEVVTVKSGSYVRICFIWKRGRRGRWKPPQSERDRWRVSLVLRRWLQAQAN
jgi:hypothetical protein